MAGRAGHGGEPVPFRRGGGISTLRGTLERGDTRVRAGRRIGDRDLAPAFPQLVLLKNRVFPAVSIAGPVPVRCLQPLGRARRGGSASSTREQASVPTLRKRVLMVSTSHTVASSRKGRRESPSSEEGAMDFDEIARQAEEGVAAGEQADTAAVPRLARTLNFSPELAEYLMALEVRIRKLEVI